MASEFRKKSQFKGVVLYSSIMLQVMTPQLGAYGKHRLDLVGHQKYKKKDMKDELYKNTLYETIKELINILIKILCTYLENYYDGQHYVFSLNYYG